MPERIQRRKSIHDRETPPRKESDQEDVAIHERGDISISRSESEEEYEETTNISKITIVQSETSRKLSRTPKQNASIIKNMPASEVTSSWKFSVLLILVAIVVYYIHVYVQPEKQLFCSFKNLQNEYPEENNSMWIQLQFGIEMILNKIIEKPAVYLLAHHETQNGMRLIKKIAEQSSKCFGKDLVPMLSEDFLKDSGSLDDYGYAIQKYKSKINQGDVFLIANLNEIPAHAARALHAICDTHNPIRKNVVIFLTLTIEENQKGNANSVAEETLMKLWGLELDRHELDPLITRVTDQIPK